MIALYINRYLSNERQEDANIIYSTRSDTVTKQSDRWWKRRKWTKTYMENFNQCKHLL